MLCRWSCWLGAVFFTARGPHFVESIILKEVHSNHMLQKMTCLGCSVADFLKIFRVGLTFICSPSKYVCMYICSFPGFPHNLDKAPTCPAF